MLSHGFLWRCLNATVPTMTLRLSAETLQCRGPVGYFLMNEAGRRGTSHCQLPFTHFISFTHKPHILYSHRPLCITLIVAADDYYTALVTLQPCSVSIRPSQGSPSAWKNSFRSYLGKKFVCCGRRRRLAAEVTVVWLGPLDLI